MAKQKLEVQITGDARGLTSAINQASGKLQSLGGKMKNIGGSLSRNVTLPLVAAGAASVKLAMDFDKSMTQIESLVGVAGDEVAKMGESAKQMASDTGRSASEAADALFFITSAGLRGDEAMQTLEASLKAAAVGLGETKTIADLATSAMNAYGSDTLSASGATDILVAAVREGKLEASELAGAMGGVIPIASNMGVGFEEIAAAMAAMSRTGTDAASGATQLNAILSTIAKPTEQSRLAFARMGLSTDDLQKSLSEDGLLNTLIMLKDRLTAAGMSFTDVVPNVRAWKGVLDLTGAGVEANAQIFESLQNTLGATDEAFKKTSESASFKMTKSLNELKVAGTEIGGVILEMVVPAVQSLGEFVKGAADAFKSFDEDTQKTIITIAGIVAAVGPVLKIGGSLVTMIGRFGPVLQTAAVGFRALTAAMIANPIIAVAAAITAIGVAIYKYTQAQKDALDEQLSLEEVESRLAEKRQKFLEESEKLAQGYGGQTKKNIGTLQDEIKVLEDKKRALEAVALAATQPAAAPAAPTTVSTVSTTGGAEGVKGQVESVITALAPLDAVQISDPLMDLYQSVANEGPVLKETIQGFGDDFMRLQETASLVGGEVANAFAGMSMSLVDSLGLAEHGMEGFLGGLLKTVLQAISMYLGQAIASAIAGANAAAAATGPAAIFTQPTFIATMVGGVLSAFAAIPKFANGGIVSAPTMGLMGEYPGAKSNPEVIAPLDKLKGLMGTQNQVANVQVGGEVKLRGSDLIVAFDRANKNRNRLI